MASQDSKCQLFPVRKQNCLFCRQRFTYDCAFSLTVYCEKGRNYLLQLQNQPNHTVEKVEKWGNCLQCLWPLQQVARGKLTSIMWLKWPAVMLARHLGDLLVQDWQPKMLNWVQTQLVPVSKKREEKSFLLKIILHPSSFSVKQTKKSSVAPCREILIVDSCGDRIF